MTGSAAPAADAGDAVAERKAAPAAPPGIRVRGQAAAVSAALDLVRTGRAQSVLLVGPAGIGKTTFALDLAAMLLCVDEAERPCRRCRGCRMVDSGNHPDLHRLAPEGPGGQIRIGARSDAEPNTVRRLICDLALLPVEGGARVAIVEHADRMNEDAQSALLKVLEEPPPGVTIILSADEDERLLPTVRSRCARIRLGPLGVRDIEELLADLGAADPPTAARLARLAGGRPGTALTWAAAPGAVTARGELARTLLDLLAARRAARLLAIRGLLTSAGEIAAALSAPGAATVPRRGRARAGAGAPANTGTVDTGGDVGLDDQAASTGRRPAPAERRRAALVLLDVWRDVTRDLALAQLGEVRRLRDPGLLDDLLARAPTLEPGVAGYFLGRLDRAGELLESNVSPELVMDGLVLAWPSLR